MENVRIQFEKLNIGDLFRHSSLSYRKLDNNYAEPSWLTKHNAYFDGPEFVTITGK